MLIMFGDGPTQGSDGATLTAEKIYLINFSKLMRKFV